MSDQFKEAIDRAGIMHAFGGGKTIESKSKRSTNWQEDYFPSWNWEEYDYRVKEEEKWRAFKGPKEVPSGLILFREKGVSDRWSVVLAVFPGGFALPSRDSNPVVESFQYAFEESEISLDGGKTWQPCGVKVNT